MPYQVLKDPHPELKKRYRLGRSIGQPGQYGKAYLATKTMKDGSKKTVAVKVLFADQRKILAGSMTCAS